MKIRTAIGPVVIATSLLWGGLQTSYDRVMADQPSPTGTVAMEGVNVSLTQPGNADRIIVVDRTGEDDAGWTLERSNAYGDWELVLTDRGGYVPLVPYGFYRVRLFTGGVEDSPAFEESFVAYPGRSYTVWFVGQD